METVPLGQGTGTDEGGLQMAGSDALLLLLDSPKPPHTMMAVGYVGRKLASPDRQTNSPVAFPGK